MLIDTKHYIYLASKSYTFYYITKDKVTLFGHLQKIKDIYMISCISAQGNIAYHLSDKLTY